MTVSESGRVLDAWYPTPQLGTPENENPAPENLDRLVAEATGSDPLRRVELRAERVVIDLDAAPASPQDAYLRLHLLSTRQVQPNTINLDGIFGVLENAVWTNRGPIDAETLPSIRPFLRAAGVEIYGIDKFPRMLDYVTPSGVRIADASRVRLGAHLAEGTVVMHEGFVNFNAGTLGPSMVEGRISQGVVVGAGSDIGGGASIMGTLSGGGKQRVSIGAKSLLGANSGIGIAIGDDCVVEAGLYVTEGTKIALQVPDADGNRPQEVKASELSGKNGLLFRRNSRTGEVEALPRTSSFSLNADLH